MLETDEQIAELLQKTHVIALVGASNKPERPSYGVMQYLLNAGYTVIPVNPGLAGQKLLGQTVVAKLADIPVGTIDLVDVFREASAAPAIVEEAIAAGAKAVWLQLGITNATAMAQAEAAGLQYVEDRCTKIEHATLL